MTRAQGVAGSAIPSACVLGFLLAIFGESGCSSPVPIVKSEPAAPVPHVGEDVLRWWSVVESIGAHGTPSERELRLNIRLESLSDADVGSFVAFYVDRLAAAARASLWRAASAAFGECDRECFSWLRAEMIFRGRTEYERILGGDATFTEYGEGPTWDAGAALLAQWFSRFPADPVPEPCVAAPPGDAIESPPNDDEMDAEEEPYAEEYEAVQTPPSRVIPPPTGLPDFCLDVNREVVHFTGVSINGPGCSHDTSDWAEPPPHPSAPFPRRRLCDRLRQSATSGGYEDEPIPCRRERALPGGYAIYVVGTPSLQDYVLVHLSEDTAEIVASLGTYSSGLGSRYEWMRGHQFRRQAGAFTVMWRDASTDWDLGVAEFTAGEACRAMRCERDGQGHLCSLPTTLRSYGGHYGAGTGEAGRHEVGEPTAQWDCRPRHSME